MLIPLKEYARRHGKTPANARQKALRGGFQTAQKIGRDWMIEEDEEWVDHRVSSGKYVGKKRKIL